MPDGALFDWFAIVVALSVASAAIITEFVDLVVRLYFAATDKEDTRP